MSICRTIVRWGIITGLAVGGVTILIGPDRVLAAFGTFQNRAEHLVDEYIDQEEAQQLRGQLHELASQYPDRIAQVRGELARLRTQTTQLERDADVARKVVAMTEADLESLASKVDVARTTGVHTVALTRDGDRVDLEIAYREGHRIRAIRQNYQERLVGDARQLELLEAQESRLVELLDRIEQEFADYQAQAWQLDRQIDAIERNERLIALTESQQATLARFNGPDDGESLRQIEARLAELHTVQEGTLQSLSERNLVDDYEHRAGTMLDGMEYTTDPFEGFGPVRPEPEREARSIDDPSPVTTPS